VSYCVSDTELMLRHRREFANLQLEVQQALSSNSYFIWVLQLIARCRHLLYSSCDLIDFEVAREGVEYEDEVEFSPKPLVEYRLGKIQEMNLLEKQAITSYLCMLGYKVTQCGSEVGHIEQLECPMLIDFDVNLPPTPTARKYRWKMFKTSGRMNILSSTTEHYVKSLRALCVVTNAKVFDTFDRLMSIVQKRQLFLNKVASNVYCLWTLELLINKAHTTPSPSRRCFHVDQYQVASAGVNSRTDVETDVTRNDTSNISSHSGIISSPVPDDNDGDGVGLSHEFYGDPLFFSRICKLEQMNSNTALSVIPFLKQFSSRWRVHVRNDPHASHICQQKDYLFSIYFV
jgi:hypothetical protein